MGLPGVCRRGPYLRGVRRVAAETAACGGRWTELDMTSEKLTAFGFGMTAWLISLCVCSSVVGLVGGGVALGYGAPGQAAVALVVGTGSLVDVVTLVRAVARSIRSK